MNRTPYGKLVMHEAGFQIESFESEEQQKMYEYGIECLMRHRRSWFLECFEKRFSNNGYLSTNGSGYWWQELSKSITSAFIQYFNKHQDEITDGWLMKQTFQWMCESYLFRELQKFVKYMEE